MKKSNFLFIIILAVIALVITLAVGKIVPEQNMTPYLLKLDSLWEKKTNEREYLADITGNQRYELIRHRNINMPGHFVEFQNGQKTQQFYLFKPDEVFIGEYFKFADLDSNATQEIIFVSAHNYVAYLNIFSYNSDTGNLLQTARVSIDTIGNLNNNQDATNNFIISAGPAIYFDLQGGYTVDPRQIYKYDFKNKKLIKNRRNSIVTHDANFFNYNNQNYLLATYVRATGNTMSVESSEAFKNSADKDSVALYHVYKHLVYEYGDFASYIMLYDDNLRFVFDPIVFHGFTNFTKSALITINKKPHIISFTNALLNDTLQLLSKSVTICNLKGELQKQIPLQHNYTEIFTKNNHAVFFDGKYLYKTDLNLNLIKRSNRTTFAQGFTDINKDNKPEFVAFTDNTLTIYSEELDKNASFIINKEIDFSPVKNSFSTINEDNKNYFIFSSNSYYYKFRYYKNYVALFYIIVYLIAFGILFLAFRLNIRRLEKENAKLEQIVIERTKEIATQKDEIQTQAEDLSVKNHHLKQLSNFKKMLTSTLVHDLKTPLNQIIAATNDKTIRQSGYSMLNIVLNILDVNKAQTTKLSVKPEDCVVEELIENAIGQVMFLAEEKNIFIEKISEKQHVIKADKSLTIRILVNLLTNAIKYSPLNDKVTIQTEEKNNSLIIDVIDYGIGISKENIQFIFEEYSQIAARDSGKIQSTGLGLKFCKLATEAQNAKIDVFSIPNQNTRFRLIFPLISITEKTTGSTAEIPQEKFLNEQEKILLLPVLKQLNEKEIFQASEILNLLKSVEESSDNIKNWKQKVKNAMLTTNYELFEALIKI